MEASLRNPFSRLNNCAPAMSDQIQVLDYPNLREEHLEILPNLSLRIQYQDIPTVAPVLSSEDKAAFLDILVKCFHPSVTNIETRFRISFLENVQATKHSHFP